MFHVACARVLVLNHHKALPEALGAITIHVSHQLPGVICESVRHYILHVHVRVHSFTKKCL